MLEPTDEKKSAKPTVSALPRPFGLCQDTILNETTTLIAQEKPSLGRHCFVTRKQDGEELVYCETSLVTLSGRKVFRDAKAKQKIFGLCKTSRFTIPQPWCLEARDGTVFCDLDFHVAPNSTRLNVVFRQARSQGEATSMTKSPKTSSSKATVEKDTSMSSEISGINEADGAPGDVVLHVEGDQSNNLVEVRLDGYTVAHIRRGPDVSQQTTYELTVAAGMDVSVIAAIVQVLDENRRDERNRPFAGLGFTGGGIWVGAGAGV